MLTLLCNAVSAGADHIDPYCKKNLKGTHTEKNRRRICWCVDDNLERLTAGERTYLVMRGQKKRKSQESEAEVAMSESDKKRVEFKEFEIFKNCSVNYKWKSGHDDIGVPDDITAP